jgi:hypothetical protein
MSSDDTPNWIQYKFLLVQIKERKKKKEKKDKNVLEERKWWERERFYSAQLKKQYLCYEISLLASSEHLCFLLESTILCVCERERALLLWVAAE